MRIKQVLGIKVVSLRDLYEEIDHQVISPDLESYTIPIFMPMKTSVSEIAADRWAPVNIRNLRKTLSTLPIQDAFYQSIYNALKPLLLKELSSNLTQIAPTQEGLYNAFMSLMNEGANQEDLRLVRTAPRTYALVELDKLRLVTSTYYSVEDMLNHGIRTEFKAAFFQLSKESIFSMSVPRPLGLHL